jgi:hypothetical protein
VIAATLNAVRREQRRKRDEQRLCQALRTGVLSEERVQSRTQTRNLTWQAWETSTGGRG